MTKSDFPALKRHGTAAPNNCLDSSSGRRNNIARPCDVAHPNACPGRLSSRPECGACVVLARAACVACIRCYMVVARLPYVDSVTLGKLILDKHNGTLVQPYSSGRRTSAPSSTPKPKPPPAA